MQTNDNNMNNYLKLCNFSIWLEYLKSSNLSQFYLVNKTGH